MRMPAAIGVGKPSGSRGQSTLAKQATAARMRPGDREAPDQEGERLRMAGDQAGRDETGRPEEDEGRRYQSLGRNSGH